MVDMDSGCAELAPEEEEEEEEERRRRGGCVGGAG